jgi:hypothetical protein
MAGAPYPQRLSGPGGSLTSNPAAATYGFSQRDSLRVHPPCYPQAPAGKMTVGAGVPEPSYPPPHPRQELRLELLGDKVIASRFRTRMCRNTLLRPDQPCPYEDRCMFAHSISHLRTAAQNIADGLTSEDAIRELKRKEQQERLKDKIIQWSAPPRPPLVILPGAPNPTAPDPIDPQATHRMGPGAAPPLGSATEPSSSLVAQQRPRPMPPMPCDPSRRGSRSSQATTDDTHPSSLGSDPLSLAQLGECNSTSQCDLTGLGSDTKPTNEWSSFNTRRAFYRYGGGNDTAPQAHPLVKPQEEKFSPHAERNEAPTQSMPPMSAPAAPHPRPELHPNRAGPRTSLSVYTWDPYAWQALEM